MTIIDNDMAAALEPLARAIFTRVLRHPGASGVLLAHLFEGDGVTMDPITREIVYLPAAAIAQLASGE